MNNPNMNSGGMPVRHKMKKVKRPIKRPINNPQNMSVPPKAPENPFNYATPAQTVNQMQDYQPDTPDKVDAFSLDAFLDGDNLPSLQPEESVQKNNFENNYIKDDYVEPVQEGWKNKMVAGEYYTGFAVSVTAVLCIILGILFAKVFLSSSKVSHSGLQGVVVNSEVPRGRARCGVAEKTQGCVLYIMNPQRQDLNGRDFYDLAAQLTGRQRYMIETGNMRYTGIKIRPGEIAQINIPPLQ